MATSIAQYFDDTVRRLVPVTGADEAKDTARIIFEDTAGYDRKFIFINGNRELSDFKKSLIDSIVDKVLAGEPVQYAVGRARFMGNDYIVDPSVLIPRPETAGLVDLITARYGDCNDLQVLDIGTGSGCIAISLARALPFCRVDAIDISAAALDVARRNAAALKAKVNFIRSDILTAAPPHARYDIIVSNPPYIGESEKSEMDSRVLDYEPHGALFVPDSDPLLFYRAIARYGLKALKSGGHLYFEINSLYAVQMRDMLADEGYSDIGVQRDYRGNYRFATAVLPQ